jgi:hypothetical protein
LEATFWVGDITQETNGIEQIRLARGVRSDNEDSPLQRQLYMPKILPVFDT